MKLSKYKKSKNRRNTRRRKIKLRGGGQKEFHFYCTFHYGDNILNLKFLYNISPILKKHGITIKYYYDALYIHNVDELQRYVNPDVVTLFTMDTKPVNAIQLWMGDKTFINNVSYNQINIFYDLFYKKILGILGLESENIKTSLFQEESYLQDIYNKLDPKFHNIDILIINAQPQSGQLDYNKSKMDEMCIRLSSKYKIVTTTHVNDSINSTMKSGLKLQDIGAISTHAKYIIAVNSGPVTTCFNIDTQKSVKKWIIFDKSSITNSEINMVLLNNLDTIDNIEQYLT